MRFEARIAAGPGVEVIQGGHRHELGDRIQRAIRPRCLGLVSFGVAGGLDPALRPGDRIVATAVLSEEGLLATDPQWSRYAARMLPGSVEGAVLGVTDPLPDPSLKALAYRRTGAVAVDMESHIVARIAVANHVPLLAIRVVTDPAQRVVPRSALAALRPDGSISILRMLRSLIAAPRELSLLWKAMADFQIARAALRDATVQLGCEFAHPRSNKQARSIGIASGSGARGGALADLRVAQRVE
jgi:hopanoid-associated phosphorylase